MKKIILKCILGLIGLFVVSIFIIALAFYLSPTPGAMLVRHMFSSEVKITDKSSFEKAKKNVEVTYSHHYDSRFKDNTYDLYLPKDIKEGVPVLVWVHGGGYVGGDKSGVKEFATKLVSDAHIAVVSMNYERAPESQYPNQLKQVSELIKELKKDKSTNMNLTNMMLGGDSAGAQITLQYTLTQTNEKYGRDLKIPHLLEKGSIKGTISYCGPVNLEQIKQTKSSSNFMKFFVRTVAWSELGTKNWKSSPQLKQASLVNHLTSTFPPTYITDGNAYSFQDQGLAFRNKLMQLSIPVSGLFFDKSKKEISHEYQFDYSKIEAKECYRQTLFFIDKYKTST
ncbi:putative lipase [Lactococcus lactis subsp. lactis]|uniref:Putative lipase n=3 Tax=Bacilli TaxID=91061 RepID=A0A0V8CP78_LACLL|nr:alpha/beta hydrolase [Lactococcus lactis]KSU03120.1 putative lipase [Lactococcus lactis subsp. lactis]